MTIINNNINDFCTMITTCTANKIHDIRIFICKNEIIKDGFGNIIKDKVSFTYVLLTPLYTAIYKGKVSNEEYDIIYKTLFNCQEQCKCNLEIQAFDKISFNESTNCLTVGRETNVG